MTARQVKLGFFEAAFLVLLAILLLGFLFIAGSFIPVLMFYNILENAILLAVLLAAVSIVYLLSLYYEKRLLNKQFRRSYQAAIIKIACENEGMITVPLLSLGTAMNFSFCDQALKDMEKKEVLRKVSEVGKGVVYQLDPKTLEDFRSRNDDDFASTQGQEVWKARFVKTFMTVLIFLFCLDIQQLAFANQTPYLIAGIATAILLAAYIWSQWTRFVRGYRRIAEMDVLTYVMDNYGELYLKELPYYTQECYETAEPLVSKWHQRNYCTVSYSEEEGGVIYTFPNHSYAAVVYEHEFKYDPLTELFKCRTKTMLACCYAFLFAWTGGYVLTHFSSLIFTVAWGIIGGIFVFWHLGDKRLERERIERTALQVAAEKDGVLTAYELAYNAVITVDEADKLLCEWERNNIARRVDQDADTADSAPMYVINGVVSMENRLESEHV